MKQTVRIFGWFAVLGLAFGAPAWAASPSYQDDKGEEAEEDEDEDEEEEEEDEWFACVGGDVYTGLGGMLRGATVLSKNGRIEEIGHGVDIPEDAEVTFRFACDGRYVALSVTDNFGALDRDVIVRYLEHTFQGKRAHIEDKEGGAGIGLFMVLNSITQLTFNIERGRRTEVIALFHAVHLARKESIMRRSVVSISPSSDGATCTPGLDWSCGWIMFNNRDRDEPPALDPNEPVLQVHRAGPHIRITANRRGFTLRAKAPHPGH